MRRHQRAYCETESDVAAGYAVEILRGKDHQDASLWVAIAAPAQASERVTRTSMQ